MLPIADTTAPAARPAADLACCEPLNLAEPLECQERVARSAALIHVRPDVAVSPAFTASAAGKPASAAKRRVFSPSSAVERTVEMRSRVLRGRFDRIFSTSDLRHGQTHNGSVPVESVSLEGSKGVSTGSIAEMSSSAVDRPIEGRPVTQGRIVALSSLHRWSRKAGLKSASSPFCASHRLVCHVATAVMGGVRPAPGCLEEPKNSVATQLSLVGRPSRPLPGRRRRGQRRRRPHHDPLPAKGAEEVP